VDTLRVLHAMSPGAVLYLLMGADTLVDLPNWREPDAIRELARLLVVHRPGEPEPRGEGLTVVPMPPSEISSSEIRRRVAAGESIEGMTPPAVAAYIAKRKLYRE
jgi:nicotinate-nucleotide adenylyltransferase